MDIERALVDGILAVNAARPKKDRDYFIMSSMGSCIRKQVLQRAGVPPTNPPDARSLTKMWLGTVIHAAAQEVLVKQGYLDPLSLEQRVSYHGAIGKMDGRTVEGETIVEIKTVDDDAITRYPEMPLNYLWQGYTVCLAEGLTQLELFQVGRSQGLTRRRLYTLPDEWVEGIDKHLEDLNTAWNSYKMSGTVPAHSHNFPWEKTYCPYLEKPAGKPQEVQNVPRA